MAKTLMPNSHLECEALTEGKGSHAAGLAMMLAVMKPKRTGQDPLQKLLDKKLTL